MTTVDLNNPDLDRFRYSCPNWWGGFKRGRQAERSRAINDSADWRESDFQRGKAFQITEGAEQ